MRAAVAENIARGRGAAPRVVTADFFRGSWRFFRRKPLGGLSVIIIILMVVAALFAGVIAPNDPFRIFVGSSLAPAGHTPSGGHVMLLGGDGVGRDVFARLLFGARISLLISVASVLIGGLAGTVLGLVSAYFGGTFDLILQRFVDGIMAIPPLVLSLLIVTLVPRGFSVSGAQFNVVLAIAILLVPLTARVVRASAMSVQENAYVEAARAIGASDSRIIFRHVLPNVTHVVIILGATYLSAAILLEASLSFLGQGTDISQPSWGNMISRSRPLFETNQHLMWTPAIAISLAVLAFNFLGDALRDVWDPRLRNV